MILTITILIWVLYSISEAYEDSQYTNFYDHKATVYPRIVNGAMVTWLWSSLQDISLIDTVFFASLLITIFWFVFELAGNLFRGNYFYYIGTTSRIDKLLKRYELPMLFLRFWLVGAAFALYFHNALNIY